jgi:DNA primase
MLNFRELNLSLDVLQVVRMLRLHGKVEGPEWRGGCPVHGSRSPKSRSLAISLELRKCFCHKAGCGWQGDLIDLTAEVRNLDVLHAAQELAAEFGFRQQI